VDVFNTVVAGYEGRPRSRDGIALARLLGSAWDARVLAVWVPDRDERYSVTDHRLRRARIQASQLLRESAAELLAGFPDWDLTLQPASTPARGLHEVAAEQQASALVVGSSHLGPVGRVVVGSTAAGLLIEAPCPVAIAPRGWSDSERSRPTRLGVGLDGCPDCESALSEARTLADRLGVDLVALGVAETGRRFDREKAKRIDSQLDSASGWGAQAVRLEGHAAEVLAAASHDLDLLMVGCRACSRVVGHPRRSVSQRLIRTSGCPLLIVPQGSVAAGRREAFE
jgi:nucleotide-binding universal stress UspA family protein